MGLKNNTDSGQASHHDDKANENKSFMRKVYDFFWRYFLAGVAITAPFAITIYLIWTFIKLIDSMMQSLLPQQLHILPFEIPGLGLVTAFALLSVVGFLTRGYVGRVIERVTDKVLNFIPFSRTVYSGIKQIIDSVMTSKSNAFREVVMLQFPRDDYWILGFVTGRTQGEVQMLLGEEMINVFVPNAPIPTQGFFMFIPRSKLIFLRMSVEEAIKLVVSGGLITPPTPENMVSKPKVIIPPQSGHGFDKK